MKKLVILVFVLFCLFTQNVFAKTYLETIYENYYQILDEEDKLQGESYITRGEFVALLMNSFNYTSDLYLCTFYDVYESSWDYKYIATAQNKEITFGGAGNEFNSNEYLKVEDAVVFLSRAYKLDKIPIGSYTLDKDLSVSDYAKDFVGYAISEGLYPNYLKGNENISIKDALDLMNKYNELSKLGFGTVKFLKGYPQTEISGRSSSILLNLKTDKPCVVYYMMVENDGRNYDYVPPVESVNSFLTSISAPNTQISVNLPAEQKKKYDIFFVLKGEDGKKSGVYALEKVSVLPFTIGDGTKKNPYKIYSQYQFEQMRNYPDKCFELCTNIEYNGDWIPIGSMRNEKNFSGVFDGGGHSIKGINVNVLDYAGLFSELDGAIVKNLYVDATVNGNSYVGIIAGVSNNAVITDCHVSGTVNAKENIAGGIVGKNNGEINNCVSSVYSVTSNSYAGGVTGANYGIVKNCISAVERVSAGMYASSVAGANLSGIIENCVAVSMEINNDLTLQCGRITTNKENGITKNNYAYQDMIAGESIYIDENMQDGSDMSWEDVISKSFYVDKLNWDFNNKWTLENSPTYMLPHLKNVSKPVLTEGLTIYAPKKVSTQDDLVAIAKSLNSHYYLANDITLEYNNSDKDYWIPLGLSDEYGNLHNSFTGTFDGRGHAIKNLKLEHTSGVIQYGLFGILYGGTVRNLEVSNVLGTVRGTVGVIAGVNYGLIENCKTAGTLDVYDRNSESLIGGICAINYTNIISCDSKVKINADTESASLGGISGSNEGFIYDCTHDAQIKSIQGGKSSNVIVGGISGTNYSGFIYNCYAYNDINSNSNTGYLGGIVGLMNNGEIYKCSSGGKIYFEAEKKRRSYAYSGGICGLVSQGLIMNSFSQSEIVVNSDSGYVGGISGFLENASIQNVYSINKLKQIGNTENVFAGGISGYSDNSYILDSVSINPSIETNGKSADICAYINNGALENNYYYDGKENFNNISFFFTPVFEGGKLGWSSLEYGGDVWMKSPNLNYPFPVLYGVENQENFYYDVNNR